MRAPEARPVRGGLAAGVCPRIAGGILALLVAAGCAHTGAPRGWLDPPERAAVDAYGGWIDVRRSGADGRLSDVRGELIALAQDSVLVLADSGLVAVAYSQISKADLMAYDSGAGDWMVLSLIGALTTVTHGFGAVVTFPVWILTGAVATAAQSRIPLHHAQSRGRGPDATGSWLELRAWARFPQGLPDGVSRDVLKPKPPRHREPPETSIHTIP